MSNNEFCRMNNDFCHFNDVPSFRFNYSMKGKLENLVSFQQWRLVRERLSYN